MKIKKSELIALIITGIVFLFILLFSVFNWKSVSSLVTMLISKTHMVKDYIRSFGFVGILILFLIIVSCFFFPVISSLPAQIAVGLSYGLFEGTIIVTLAFFVASQIYYLLRKDLKIISKRKSIHDDKIKNIIQNSSVNIHLAMLISYIVPFIPFIVISGLAYDGLKKYWQYLLYTLIGPIPEVIFTLYVGEILLEKSPIATIITLLIIIIVVVFSILFKDKIISFIFRPKKKEGNQNGTN